MDERAHGVIVRIRPLTESSLIIHWLTEESGRIATVAKGARRPKSAFRGKLDLFFEAEFSFKRSARSELHNLKEIQLLDSHVTLREDLQKIRLLSYASALLEQTTESDTPTPELYALFRSLLVHASQYPPRPRHVFAFELKLLRELGQEPDLEEAKLSTATRRLFEELMNSDWAAIDSIKADKRQVNQLQKFLHDFLNFHIDRIPKGRADALGSTVRQPANV